MNTKHTQERREGDNLELAHCLHITSTQLVERKSKNRALASTHRHIYKLTKASKGAYIHRLSHTHKPIHGRWSYHSTSTHKGHYITHKVQHINICTSKLANNQKIISIYIWCRVREDPSGIWQGIFHTKILLSKMLEALFDCNALSYFTCAI